MVLINRPLEQDCSRLRRFPVPRVSEICRTILGTVSMTKSQNAGIGGQSYAKT